MKKITNEQIINKFFEIFGMDDLEVNRSNVRHAYIELRGDDNPPSPKTLRSMNKRFNKLAAELIDFLTASNESDLFAWFGDENRQQFERSLFKSTECGAGITWHPDGIELHSIVEGCDAEVGPIKLEYPFTKSDYDGVLNHIELEVDCFWYECNEMVHLDMEID